MHNRNAHGPAAQISVEVDLYARIDTSSLDTILAQLPVHLHPYAASLVDNPRRGFRVAFPVKVAQSWYDWDLKIAAKRAAAGCPCRAEMHDASCLCVEAGEWRGCQHI